MSYGNFSEDTSIAQAMIEMTDANLSPADHETDWETEVARLRLANASDDGGASDDFARIIEESTLLA